MYINTFKYTPKDVSCQLCTEYVKKLGCTALRCPWLAERIEAGVVGYREAVMETFPRDRRLSSRLNLLIKHYPGSLWSNEQHECRMQYQCAVQGYRRRRDTNAYYSAFVPNARSLLTLDMGIDRSYLSPVEPWRNENRDEMLRVTLRVEGKPDYTLVLPADEEHGPFTRDEYMRTGNDRMQLIVQIESQNGLDHIDEILSLDGIDMVASGREDISQALGVPGQKDHPLVIEAENYILAKAFEHKKIPTLSVSSKERMQELWEKGVRCFSIGRDEDLCLKALKNQMTKMALTPEEKQEWHTWIFLG